MNQVTAEYTWYPSLKGLKSRKAPEKIDVIAQLVIVKNLADSLRIQVPEESYNFGIC